MKIIYHKGTGTWFASDEAVVIDTDLLPEGTDDLIDLLEIEGDEIAERYGRHLFADVTSGNAIHFTPSALREEANAKLNSGAFTSDAQDEMILEWVSTQASDEELNNIAHWVLDNDEVWSWFNDQFWQGITEHYNVHLQKSRDADAVKQHG